MNLRMTVLLTALVLAAPAYAQDRVVNTALGVVAGAVVLGPIGAVAGGAIGYGAGRDISRGLGLSGRRHARKRAHHRRQQAYRNR